MKLQTHRGPEFNVKRGNTADSQLPRFGGPVKKVKSWGHL